MRRQGDYWNMYANSIHHFHFRYYNKLLSLRRYVGRKAPVVGFLVFLSQRKSSPSISDQASVSLECNLKRKEGGKKEIKEQLF